MLITTTPIIEGKRIVKYYGTVSYTHLTLPTIA